MTFEENGSLVGGGRYRPLTPLGRGGMGIVWLADDLLLERRVAIKRLHSEHTAEELPVRRQRAMREAQVLARLRHPSIVEIYDMFQEDDHPCIVMPYIEGDSLQDLMDDDRRPGKRELASIALRVLSALDTAHRAGVMHRDVKPANIMVAEDGKVFLVDFGIALMVGDSKLTSSNTLLGTLELLAPERLEGREAGPAADLWSLGVTLFTVLEGYSPFRRDDNTPATMMAIIHDEPPPPAVPGPLAGTIARLLVKDPARRLDAPGLAAELRSIVEGPATSAAESGRRKPSAPEKPPAPDSTRVDLASLSPGEATRVIAGMDREAAAALVGRLAADKARGLLMAVKPRIAADLLLSLEPGQAGQLLASLPARSAGKVLDALAEEPERAITVVTMLSPMRTSRGMSYASGRSAATLLATLPAAEATSILRHVDRRAIGEIFTALFRASAADPLIAGMPVEVACELLDSVPPQIIAAIVRSAPSDRSHKLLAGLSQPIRRQVDRHLHGK